MRLRTIRRRLRQAYCLVRWRFVFGEIGPGTILRKPLKVVGGRRIRIGSSVQLGALFRLEAIEAWQGKRYDPEIVIGDRTTAETGLHVAAASSVRIGSDVLIASWVFITDHGHSIAGSAPPRYGVLDEPLPVQIGNGSWLGERATILPGVTLGDGCVVGAGSVVTRNFDAGTVIAGVPGRALRKRPGFG